MADQKFGETFDVEFEADKTRRLVIDFNTLCRAEEVSGLNFLNYAGELTGVRLRALVWAGLQYGPGETPLTLDEVGLMCGAYNFEIMTAFIDAWEKAMPDLNLEGDDENPQETATAPS